MTITHDPATWPTGDKLWALARAIAFAEGANVPGDVPDRLNNPGDISDDLNLYGSEDHDGSSVTKFPDKQTGWNVLRSKLYRIQQGHSTVYPLSMTFIQFAQTWAGNWQPWVNEVTRVLNVDRRITLEAYFTADPDHPDNAMVTS